MFDRRRSAFTAFCPVQRDGRSAQSSRSKRAPPDLLRSKTRQTRGASAEQSEQSRSSVLKHVKRAEQPEQARSSRSKTRKTRKTRKTWYCGTAYFSKCGTRFMVRHARQHNERSIAICYMHYMQHDTCNTQHATRTTCTTGYEQELEDHHPTRTRVRSPASYYAN